MADSSTSSAPQDSITFQYLCCKENKVTASVQPLLITPETPEYIIDTKHETEGVGLWILYSNIV